MATTTNYGWTTPDDTDLVKDGAAAIRTLGSSIDTSFVADQGDLLLGGASDIFEPLAIGAADAVLTSNGTTASWVAPAGASGPAFSARNSTSQSVTQLVNTKVVFDTEEFDTDNCFASNRFTPNKEGYYQINAMVQGSNDTAEILWILAYKNGSSDRYVARFDSLAVVGAGSAFLMYFNGTTDYLEIFVKLGGATPSVPTKSFFSGVWIRS
jgi:hypothetical protein